RLAEAQHLFSLVPPQIQPRHEFRQRLPRPGAHFVQTRKTYLPFHQWPPALQQAFRAFQTWATAPLVQGRPPHFRKRQQTIDDYRESFEGYFGYLHHTLQLSPTFDHLFDIDLVTRYVHWHVNDCHHKPTLTIRYFLAFLHTLVRQYRPMPEL